MTNSPKVYILVRTKHLFFDYKFRRRHYRYFKECLKSALCQDYSDISILILQDTLFVSRAGVYSASMPDVCAEILEEWQYLPSSADKIRDIYFYRANCGGPALAIYYLRKQLQSLFPKDRDIVLMLDDDDFFLRENVVSDIVSKMSEERINPNTNINEKVNMCILPYEVAGKNSLDITNGAGTIHRKLVIEPLADEKDVAQLAFAESMGWTKAYTYDMVCRYLDDLQVHFAYDESKLVGFYRKNNAYEDFPDIINICRKEAVLTACQNATHVYRKIPSSVTARPKLKDFRQKRTAYLSLLLSLSQIASLTDKGKEHIARYVIVKLVLIENIMAKFRIDGYNFKLFRICTSKGDFYNLLIDRLKKDGLLDYLAQLLMNVEIYKKEVDGAINPERVIKMAGKAEVDEGNIDIQQCIREEVALGSKSADELKIKLRWTIAIAVLIFLTITALLILIYIYVFDENKDNINFLSIVWAVLSVMITYISQKYVDYLKKIEDDEKTKTVYKSELEDLIRHLIASLNVLHKIDKEMVYDKKPAAIHFKNLKIPANSILLSNEPINNMMLDDLNTISRVKVNIRNINNSADFLNSMVESRKYTSAQIKKALSWEITRYYGYIINMKYVVNDPSFRFPKNKEDLDRYVNIKNVLADIAKEIKISGDPNPIAVVTDRYEAYKQDREEERKVVMF